MRNFRKYSFLLLCGLSIIQLIGTGGCASIQHPTGGPRDSVAPVILKETPKNFSTNFKPHQITLEFDEYFKLTNEFKEISISPAMEKSPNLKVKKKQLLIQFQEPLADSTTYTINFGKAIADYNEGNVLKNYIYVLSTGDKIDSLSISGKVINTLTKEPVLDATAFLLAIEQDTTFGKKRASIFTTTDSSGNFSIKYLRPHTYKLYALYEKNGDRIYNSPAEEIGFMDDSLVLQKDTSGLVLELFKENPKKFRVIDRKIEKDGRITYIFNKTLEKPEVKILEPKDLNTFIEYTPSNDTAYVWAESLEFDSINVALLDNNTALDTVVIRRNKRDTYDRALTVSDNIPSGRLKPETDIILTLSAPVKSIDGKKFTLLQDSVPANGLRVSRDSLSTRKIFLKYPWKEDKQYTLTIADDGFTGTYGGTNKEYKKTFSKDLDDNYGILTTHITVPDTAKKYIVQLLDSKDIPVSSHSIDKNATLNFPMMSAGKYYLRVIFDANKNGKWDTGDVAARKQPEKVWNYPTEIMLRANFEIEEKITIPKDL